MIRQRAVLDAIRDAVFLADIDTGMIVDANHAAESLCGRSIAELRSLHHTQLHPAEAADLATRAFGEHAQVPGLTEGTVLHKAGHRIPVEIASSHFTDEDGRRILIGVFRDTTERNAARESLRRSEQRFRQVAESAGEFIWEVNAAGLYLYASPVVERILGYTPEEVVGKIHFYDLFVPETREELKKAAFEAFARQEPFQGFLNWNVRKDGRIVALETNAVPVCDANGSLLGYRGADTDVTARKQAEAALREREEHLASIYNTVQDVIFHLAVEPEWQFRFISVNPAFLRTTGLSLESVIGRTVNEVIPEPSLTLAIGKYRRAVEENAIVRWEETTDYPTGRLTGEVCVAPVVDDKGRCTHLVGSVHDITGRRRAEATLRESEGRFRDLADTAPVLIWVAGPHKLCIFFNKTWLEFTGRTMAEEMGDGWADGVHPDDLGRCVATYGSAFDERRSFQIEYRLRRADGEYRWILDHGVPRYRVGEFIGFIGSCIDVTEQKLLEERLRANEAQLVDAQRLAKLGSYTLEVETGRVRWSDEMYKIFGLSGNAPLDFQTFLSLVHPKDRELIREAQTKAVSSSEPVITEFRVIRPDRAERVIRSIVEAFKNDRGAPVRFVGASQDITNYVNARELMRESERRLRNAERLAHVGNWQWEISNNHVTCSEETLRILGRPQDSTPTLDELLRAVVPQDRWRVNRWGKGCLSKKGGPSIEFQIARPNGDLRTITCTREVSLDEDGLPARVVGSCQDVTDSRRAQEQAFARHKLESLGTLSGGIAHDFNNLLGAVLAQSELALEELAGGLKPEEGLQRIRDVAVHGAGIVRQLMIYAGKETETLELVDVSRIASEMMNLLKVSVSKRAVLEMVLDQGLPPVRANAAQLRQIVMNLVTNASEAMEDRDGVIRVTGKRITMDQAAAILKGVAGGDYLHLEVSDTGRGMSADAQDRVFDPFFTTKSAGRGLGMAVVHGIVRKLNGAIRVASEAGKGTTFQVWLPSAEDQAGEIANPVQPAGEASGPFQEVTVLVVEDEDSLRQPVVKLLRKKGFAVLEAADGSAAIELLRADARKIDIMLLDLTIPGASSHEVVACAEHARPDLRVLLTSAYGEDMAMSTMKSPLVCAFIRKPFQLGNLVLAIRNVVYS